MTPTSGESHPCRTRTTSTTRRLFHIATGSVWYDGTLEQSFAPGPLRRPLEPMTASQTSTTTSGPWTVRGNSAASARLVPSVTLPRSSSDCVTTLVRVGARADLTEAGRERNRAHSRPQGYARSERDALLSTGYGRVAEPAVGWSCGPVALLTLVGRMCVQ
jgi:hypothetical protein